MPKKDDLTKFMEILKNASKTKIEIVEEKPFSLDETKTSTTREIEELERILTNFFKVNDKYDLAKTDIPPHLLNSLVTLLFFAENPLPVYNRYLKEKKLTPLKIEDLKDYLLLYIHARISVERKGRKEGVEIAKGVVEKIKEKIESETEEVKKIYDRLLR